METQMLAINQDSLAKAAQLIAQGEVVAFPTETVYGLGADVFCQSAVKKIFEVKGRPQDNPLIVHIAKPSDLSNVASFITPQVEKLFSLMPSSLTVVVPKNPLIPDLVTAGLNSVAVRCPLSQQARDFISACGKFICAPSANLSGRPSPTSAQAVYQDLAGKIPLILKGDDCQVGIESTVLSMCGEPTILRPGIVTKSQIEEVLGTRVQVLTDTASKVNSPGVRYRHYAPSCPCRLFDGKEFLAAAQAYEQIERSGKRAVIFCKQDLAEYFVGNGCQVMNLGESDAQSAHNYYAYLNKAEKEYDYIIICFSPSGQVGESLLNRMQKSAYGK